jgi:hypothetical protein
MQAALGKKVERRVLDGVGGVYNGFTGVLVLKAVIPHNASVHYLGNIGRLEVH